MSDAGQKDTFCIRIIATYGSAPPFKTGSVKLEKGKVKFHPLTGHEDPEGLDVQL